MRVKKVDVKNFRSFKEVQVELGEFNVMIGANASGKSNFVQIFQFFRDIKDHGLDNAISMQGGVEYLRNMALGTTENFSLKLIFDTKPSKYQRVRVKGGKGWIFIKTYETTYEFELGFKKGGAEFEVLNDRIVQKCEFAKFEKEKLEKLGRGKIFVFRSKNKIKVEISKDKKEIPLSKDDLFSPFLLDIELPANTLLLQNPVIAAFIPLSFRLGKAFDISIYDFDPKLPKKATPVAGKAVLEEDGSNLSIIVKSIIENKEKKRKFLNLVQDLLPFTKDLGVEKFADKSLLFKIREKYFNETYLPASLISDGTINILALIIALYFENKALTIIEEPERNIHPYLISKVVDMMKEASKDKQIIVTTHNPEMVKNAGLENLLLVTRTEEGFSKISRPADKETLKVFLENDIGIEELYVKNLLGG
ncbi:MAG: hypothetical protein PWQ48_1789 [Thermotogaceae bacterium]|nr:hypothetical protein [Thermotogaceae bacterium]